MPNSPVKIIAWMRVINLDTRNRVINIEKLYVGSLNASTVRVGEIFRSAIQRNAASIIILHNHPSGDPAPSPEDVALTRTIVQAGKLLDIEVLDHLVIGQGRWVSLKERGLGFKQKKLVCHGRPVFFRKQSSKYGRLLFYSGIEVLE
jgi:hypothetical protein